MLDIIKAFLYGIVEGITEWLPVSSTGHMILLEEFVKMDVSQDFWNMFLVVIQLGAILAVVLLYWNQIFPWDFSKKARQEKRVNKKDVWMLWAKILVACIPAAIVGVLFDDWLDEHLYNGYVVATMLIIFGILFIIIENKNKGKEAVIKTIEEIDFKTALIIGVFQLIAAIFPGTSRSGATIVGSLMIGVSRTAAANFTFLLAIPVMFGASLLKLVKFGLAFSGSEVAILATGMIVAFVISVIVIKFLMSYIRKHDFKVFGWYRIILGVVVLAYFFLK
ncbi:undecaprenyl-diphosphate phosphatase [Butyrivibrio fibrisolvens]|jgi:undecaprenyl-diphosphatase|uniref:Undecaprenyl-diphosphatase n=1 Tax=Butyrivibrio fibrisolvens TaxID=831 RepID=A0A317FZQ1_BUTFI|nr:undecaprenyl-diphosphate phosphatase [Butyrivibrio fibrisolvens]MBQ1457034.1 undecaprenyl-diphosphate phosphatase [Butyrivibrio sp.]PWT26351.1 undecaprenyl-diphosphate phosphatase [Butyrivibrio fibrisolvens]